RAAPAAGGRGRGGAAPPYVAGRGACGGARGPQPRPMGDACSRACGLSSGRPEPEEGLDLRPELRAAMAGGHGAEMTSKLSRQLSKAGEKCEDCDGWGFVNADSSDEEDGEGSGPDKQCHRMECPACQGGGIILGGRARTTQRKTMKTTSSGGSAG
ncbi:unnamed protein product, partial [Prorocentrum cordatum]